MKRREFLEILQTIGFLTAGSGLQLFPRLAGADGITEEDGKFFLLIQAPNGWDVTLGLDPKVHENGSEQADMFLEYRPDQILGAESLRLGPACEAILPYAASFSVINGVFMSDVNQSHDANLSYASSGNSSGAADLPMELAYAKQAGPFGVAFDQTMSRGSRVIMPMRISNLEALRSSSDISVLQKLMESLGGDSAYRNAQLTLMRNSSARLRLVAALDKLKLEIDRTSDATEVDGAGELAAIVAAAFTSGACLQAKLSFSASLDTHSSHEGTHLTEQKKVWKSVANLLRIFKNTPVENSQGNPLGSLLDRTTIMVVSEFSRTPALSSSKGKDHNPLTNSVLLAGAGVRGGLSFGASRLVLRGQTADGKPRHSAGAVDFATGRIAKTKEEARSDDFQVIFPENVVATVLEIMGVDRSKVGAVGSQVAHLAMLMKKTV
jgi:hypothetical protein